MLVFAVIAAGCVQGVLSSCTGASVFLHQAKDYTDQAFTIRPRPCNLSVNSFAAGEVAHGTYNDTYEKLGWDLLAVYTNPDVEDADAAFGAGIFEGHATARRIEQAAVNNGVDVFNMSRGLAQFLDANSRFLEAMETLGPSLPAASADRRIWYHSHLVCQNQKENGFTRIFLSFPPSVVHVRSTIQLNATH